ncbi:MAG: protein-tyrosine-phosphatase [Bacteroidetes bacterium]|nr:protein-tyrosine-phosphatase [Bacteroidota bacterium]MDA0898618.1 protein-tyrosine-phosphatase [Bacteroidota bacterium]
MSQEVLKNLFSAAPSALRLEELDALAALFNAHSEDGLAVNFICTHNSRRSHFSEILFRTAAKYYGHENVESFSGGTEGTALYPEVAESFKRYGFTAVKDLAPDNPHWQIFHPLLESEDHTPFLFSKAYHEAPNPASGYVAVMVCDSANEACPMVVGAAARFPLTFVDPKRSDGTPECSDVYDATLKEIAAEMGYLARKLA